MKKVLAIAALGMITLASCKKDYTCACKSTQAGSTAQNYEYQNVKKKDAQKSCDEIAKTWANYSAGSCELK